MESPGPIRLTSTLALGVLSVSFGSIFVRLAAAPALAVAAYRVLWATVMLAPFLWLGPRRELTRLSRAEWVRLLLAGGALALHFALWIASLSYTSVASSVLLVTTSPFFIGLASQFLFRQPCTRAFWVGLAAAFMGSVVIFHEDLATAPSSMKGNALAIAGAVAMAVYLIVGGRLRRRLSLLAYVWPVYAAAAVALTLGCAISETPLRGYGASTHLFLFLLGLVPQCIGHTTYNWSLRWLPPALVGLVGLAEPVGAGVLAWIILGESVGGSKLLGGGIVLWGIFVASRAERIGTKEAPPRVS